MAVLFLPVNVIAFTTGFGNGDYNPLPDTGQTKCYDESGNEIACPSPGESLYGQDANYHGTPKSFTLHTINGDAVVVDNNTRLMWQQSDDGVERTWQEAKDYCENLEYAGYFDWRLPEVFELRTLVDYSIPSPGPTIDTSVFSCMSSNYWSATLVARTADWAWFVRFGNSYGNRGPTTYAYYVRCVRDGLQ